jgi:hypothetical protein
MVVKFTYKEMSTKGLTCQSVTHYQKICTGYNNNGFTPRLFSVKLILANVHLSRIVKKEGFPHGRGKPLISANVLFLILKEA